mmetsp:Transcript_45932/g.116793  ORF Transcript_45932/g.116793 Transcript_45932/m.116793 type:complete len:927 (+) Transcript_45932:75-2855(+)
MAEPAAKRAKTEGEAAPEEPEKPAEGQAKAEEPKEPEEPVEKEEDAKPDKSPKVKDSIVFHTQDTTMNLMQSTFGNVLMPLTDGGMQYLLAGARANTGVKVGRYAFEVKLVEVMNPADDPAARQRTPMPRCQLRVGFATEGSSLFIGDGEDSVCFDSEGSYIHNRIKTTPSQKFGTGTIVTVLLNLDPASPNANTISLFKDGERACQPQALPESLRGKMLFPAVTFKNVTVHYNFGPAPLAPLPFTCRMLQEATAKDAKVVPAPAKDAKHEVVFPVCLPDEGTFDWLDMFLEKNPQYIELSDRAMLTWAEKSGLTKPKGFSARSSNDKPEMGFGIAVLDDHSIRRVLQAIAPVQQRNYVVMEVKSNLMKDERKELISKWAGSSFKKTAVCMMGDPPASFKKRSQEVALTQKQLASDAEFKAKQEEERRKKMLDKRQRQLEKERQKALKQQAKVQAEVKKQMDIAKKKAEALAAGEEYKEEEEEKKEEPEEAEEEEKEEEEEDEPMDEEPPKVELTAEEKKLVFRRNPIPDLTSYSLNTSFVKFSVPDKDEGFDEIRYDWSKQDKCRDYLKQWVQEKKTTTRIEDLQPGDWFVSKWKDWQKTLQSWHAKQNTYKAAVAKRAADKAARQARRAAAAAAREARAKAAAAKKEMEAKAAAEKKAAEGGEGGDETKEAEEKPAEDVKMEDPEPEEKEESEDDKDEGKVDFDKLDVFGVEDVLDVGGGEPLFSTFGFEDWTMMSLRFELHLLAHAFKRDVKDPDRIGIHVEHLAFYYNKYFKKHLNHKLFGLESIEEMLQLVKETVYITKKSKVLESLLPDDMENFSIFVMLTEEARRERNRRVDMGDESAKLKFSSPSVPGAPQVVAAGGFTAGVRPAVPPAAPRPVITPQVRPVTAGGTTWPQTPPRPVAAGVLRPAAAGWRPPQPAWRG